MLRFAVHSIKRGRQKMYRQSSVCCDTIGEQYIDRRQRWDFYLL